MTSSALLEPDVCRKNYTTINSLYLKEKKSYIDDIDSRPKLFHNMKWQVLQLLKKSLVSELQQYVISVSNDLQAIVKRWNSTQ